MSRLQYRAWHKTHQKMFRVIGWREDDDDQLVVWCKDERDITFRFADTINGIPGLTVLMQATGLKDRNGKDIFEGDIVQITNEWSISYCSPVSWGKSSPVNGWDVSETWVIAVKWIESRLFPLYPLCQVSSIDTIKVIGNIYETPEMEVSQ